MIPTAAIVNAGVKQTKNIHKLDEGLEGNSENAISDLDAVDKKLEKINFENTHEAENEWCAVSPAKVGRNLEKQ